MSAASKRTKRTISGSPILWHDGALTHACEAAEIHPGVRLIWTLCGRDVPAGAAYTREGEVVTCRGCRKESERG